MNRIQDATYRDLSTRVTYLRIDTVYEVMKYICRFWASCELFLYSTVPLSMDFKQQKNNPVLNSQYNMRKFHSIQSIFLGK